MIELQNEQLNKITPELERFCDFLGNIISKYIHEIELNETSDDKEKVASLETTVNNYDL